MNKLSLDKREQILACWLRVLCFVRSLALLASRLTLSLETLASSSPICSSTGKTFFGMARVGTVQLAKVAGGGRKGPKLHGSHAAAAVCIGAAAE